MIDLDTTKIKQNKPLKKDKIFDENGSVLIIVLIAIFVGAILIFVSTSLFSTIMIKSGQNVDSAKNRYLAQAGLNLVVADILEGKEVKSSNYTEPLILDDEEIVLSIEKPFYAMGPTSSYYYIDPGVEKGLSSLRAQQSYFFFLESVRQGSDLRVNWSFTPNNKKWRIRLYEGYGVDINQNATVLAKDDFETGDYLGGTGWNAEWTSSENNVSVVTDFGPVEGNRHLKLAMGDAEIVRSFNVSNASNLRIQFWVKFLNFEPGESAGLSVSQNGSDFFTIKEWKYGQDDGIYRYEDIDLSSYESTSQLWIKFFADMNSVYDLFFIDDLKIVSRANAGHIEEFFGSKGPAVLFVPGEKINGGQYTIEFKNDSSVDLVSNDFSNEAKQSKTWIYAQAYEDHLVTATVNLNEVSLWIRQVPGKTLPAIPQEVYFLSFLPYAIELLHLEDDDGDGIPNIIDGRKVGSTFVDESKVSSKYFSDLHGLGTSFGSIDNLNGLKVTVQNLPEPKGFLIIASGGPGAAELTVCSNYLSISDGDEVEITC